MNTLQVHTWSQREPRKAIGCANLSSRQSKGWLHRLACWPMYHRVYYLLLPPHECIIRNVIEDELCSECVRIATHLMHDEQFKLLLGRRVCFVARSGNPIRLQKLLQQSQLNSQSIVAPTCQNMLRLLELVVVWQDTGESEADRLR